MPHLSLHHLSLILLCLLFLLSSLLSLSLASCHLIFCLPVLYAQISNSPFLTLCSHPRLRLQLLYSFSYRSTNPRIRHSYTLKEIPHSQDDDRKSFRRHAPHWQRRAHVPRQDPPLANFRAGPHHREAPTYSNLHRLQLLISLPRQSHLSRQHRIQHTTSRHQTLRLDRRRPQ